VPQCSQPFRILPLLVPFPAAALAAQGHVWHVDDSGGADFTTVQAAIDAAADGDTIVIEFGNDSSVTARAAGDLRARTGRSRHGAIEGLSIACRKFCRRARVSRCTPREPASRPPADRPPVRSLGPDDPLAPLLPARDERYPPAEA
jgi:hypothetical protein